MLNPVGYLKYGRKSLYFYKKNGTVVQVEPVCLLDFYVHDSRQRSGVGRALFDEFLKVFKCS